MFKKAGKTLLGLAVAASCMQAHAAETKKVDVLLVGGGIMSSTLAVWLHELEPAFGEEKFFFEDEYEEMKKGNG